MDIQALMALFKDASGTSTEHAVQALYNAGVHDGIEIELAKHKEKKPITPPVTPPVAPRPVTPPVTPPHTPTPTPTTTPTPAAAHAPHVPLGTFTGAPPHAAPPVPPKK
jgi:hypothetical protein